MRIRRLLVVFPVLLALTGFLPARASSDNERPRHVKVTEYREGRAICPSRRLVIGNVAVHGGRCYLPAVLRDSQGAFLAFVDPAVRIPPGQLVRLDTTEGRALKARILYLVPMPAQMTAQVLVIPVNTVQLVRLREEDDEEEDGDSNQHEGDQSTHIVGSRLTVIMTGAPLPNLSVTFVVQI